MTKTADSYWLVVKQAARETARLKELIPTLAQEFRLDAYLARQRLLGPSLALLAHGKEVRLEGLAAVLAASGVVCWVLPPTPPRFAPRRVRNLQLTADALLFRDGDKTLRLERGSRVVAVLADLSGALIDKGVRRIMVQNAYRGTTSSAPLSAEERYREVLRGQPVLDIYLLEDNGSIRAAVRLVGGGFDPKGLGKRATYSAAGNLAAVIDTLRDYAGTFTLDSDFGLAALPGCQLRREEGEEARRANLASLARYGWLLADLQCLTPVQQPKEQEARAALETLATLTAVETPVLAAVAAGAGIATLPGTEAIAAEIGLDEPEPAEEEEDAPPRELPLPPDPPPRSRIWVRSLWLQGAVSVTAFGAFWLLGDRPFWPLFYRHGVLTGIVPGALSLGLFAAGFSSLHLVRTIENTPTSKIRSLAMGLVEVHGRAVRQYALVSPLSGMACVYYRLRRYRRDRESKWRLVSDTSSGHIPFALEDETGRVTVDPRRAKVRAGTKRDGYGDGGNLLFGTSGSGSQNERWVEEVIPEGTSLYILGAARTQARPGHSLRERTVERLRALKQDRQALAAFDADGDGRISHEEWETARTAVEDEVLHASLAEGGEIRRKEQIEIGHAPGWTRPFIIAETASEAHLTRSLSWLVRGLFAAGLGTAIWALYLAVALLRG